MTDPRVLLVFPGSLHGGAWAAGPRVKPELVMVRSELRRRGAAVDVLDLEVDAQDAGLTDDADRPRDASAGLERHLARARAALAARSDAGLVAIACLSSLQYSATLAVAAMVREDRPGVAIAAFGLHPTVRPDDFTDGKAGDLIDWVLQGDAEISLAELAGATGAAGRPAGRARRVAGEPLAMTAEALPDYTSYPYARPGLPALGVFLSRGCQYQNAACFLGPGGGLWQPYEPSVALDLLQALEGLAPDEIEVLDPAFGVDAGWRADVLARLAKIERRATPLSLTARADAFTRADLDAMYGGRLHVHFNLGTLSPTLLRETGVADARRRLERALDTVRYASAKGVPAELDLVFGQPGETRATATESLDTLEGLVAEFPNTSLRLVASRWAYLPFGSVQADVEAPAARFGTRIAHPRWWCETGPSRDLAAAVVPSADLADLEPGDDSYWRPRFEVVSGEFEARLTREARLGMRSHESVGSAATGVPQGFWREPR